MSQHLSILVILRLGFDLNLEASPYLDGRTGA